MKECYAGNCSQEIDPVTEMPLDLALLRTPADVHIREGGYQPA